jgi:hypothetical protein
MSTRAAAAAAAGLLMAGPPRLGEIRLGVVDGPSGSGKTSFAEAWAEACRTAGAGDVVVLTTDLVATWENPFGWWERLDAGVLHPLGAGRPGRLLANDWSSGYPVPTRLVTVEPPGMLILEGVSAGRWTLADRITTLVWVEIADRALRLERAVARDGESSRRHLQRWQDQEDAHFAADGTKLRADLVVRPY